MDLSREVMKKAYAPFWRLAIYNCFQYTVLFLFLNLFIFILTEGMSAERYFPWVQVISINFFLCLIAFKIPLLSLIEQKNNFTKRALVQINMIETDGLFGSYKNSNQEIKYCYPKNLQAERDKLICTDKNGKQLHVRMIGSKNKIESIQKLLLFNDPNVYITFGRLTRIVFVFEPTETCDTIHSNHIKHLNQIF